METLDVKLGGRSYPLTLSSEEVDVVRAAAQAVEAQIVQLKSKYAITAVSYTHLTLPTKA